MNKRPQSPHVDDRNNFAELLERTSVAMIKHLTDRPNMPDDCSQTPKALRQEVSNLPLPTDGMAADHILFLVEQNIMP